MDGGKAGAYHYAVEWLEHARAAYCVMNREADWQTYLAGIREKHTRKYKLMGLLKALG